MTERTLNFGADATDADYQIRDSDPAGGDFIIEHLPSGATFEYDASESAWVATDSISAGEGTITNGGLEFDVTARYPHERTSPVRGTVPTLVPHPNADNPVLSAADVSDTATLFVADPFIVWRPSQSQYEMLFEVTEDSADSEPAQIGHGTSQDGLSWTYDQFVLNDANTHFAHPYIFRTGGQWYMMPDLGASGNGSGEVRLYTPDTSNWSSWSVDSTLLSSTSYSSLIDPQLLSINGHYYILAWDGVSNTVIFDSSSLKSGWSEHADSPVARPGGGLDQRLSGRPYVHADKTITAWYMDNSNSFGERLVPYRLDLSPSSYSETRIGTGAVVEATGEPGQWNEDKMHHVDILPGDVGSSDLVAVDGRDNDANWKIGIWTVAPRLGPNADVENLDIGGSDFVASGDPLMVGPSFGIVADNRSYSTTATTLENTPADHFRGNMTWDDEIPSGATGYWTFNCNVNPGTDETVHIQLYNNVDNEVVLEQDNITSFTNVSLSGMYTPSTTGSRTSYRTRIETDPGSNASEILDDQVHVGIKF